MGTSLEGRITINLVEDVGIQDAEKRFMQYPFEFSGGQRQRIGIAFLFLYFWQ